jgi:hypothetical protein
MPTPRQVHSASTRLFSALMILIGLAMIASTLARGHVLAIGVLLGALFCAVGAGRLYIELRPRGPR